MEKPQVRNPADIVDMETNEDLSWSLLPLTLVFFGFVFK